MTHQGCGREVLGLGWLSYEVFEDVLQVKGYTWKEMELRSRKMFLAVVGIKVFVDL